MNNIEKHLAEVKKIRSELETMNPEFKPQYGNKHRSQTMREIAEHSNFFEIEIHPNIIDELIVKERLDRANAFVRGKLAVLSAAELAGVQVEVQMIMCDQEIARLEDEIARNAPVVNPAEYDPQMTIADAPPTATDPIVTPKTVIETDTPKTVIRKKASKK